MEQVLYQLPGGWEWKSLGDIVDFRNGYAFKSSNFSDSGLPVLRISNIQRGGISNKNLAHIPEKKLDSKSSDFYVEPGDIVIAMSGATTGKVAFNDTSERYLQNQRVGRFVIKNATLRKYVFYYLSSKVEDNLQKSLGAAQPNLSTSQIKDIRIPVQSEKEQKRIVEKLDALLTRIDTIIVNLQESLVLSDALYLSELNNVFSQGDGKSPLKELNEVAEVARGKSKHRPRNDKTLFGGEYPFIQTGDVRNAQKYITKYSATYNKKGLQQSKLWPKNTICLTIAANIGDVAILDMDACFPDSVVGIASHQFETDYLYYFLTTLQQHLDNKANAAAQKNINLKILSEILIPVPNRDQQKNIIKRIKKIDELAVKVKSEIEHKITIMQQLKASILGSAFKGEL